MTDWPTKDAQIEAQEHTIDMLRFKIARLRKEADRAEKLQEMYDNSQNYIRKLKAQLTPEAKAQWIFQEAEQCQKNERS